MRPSDENRRLALAAPFVQLLVGTAFLALAARPVELVVPMLVAAVVLPAAVGWWVFAGRPAVSRILLALWAPAGEGALFLLVVLATRASVNLTEALLVSIAIGPLVVLFVAGILMLRGRGRSAWLIGLGLWLLAIAEAVAAVPLSETFGGAGGMEALAGAVMLLFAPAAALGAWGGLALAGRIREPAHRDLAGTAVPDGSDCAVGQTIDAVPDAGTTGQACL